MDYSFTLRRRNAFVMTETELNVMAAAAIIGLSSSPNTGFFILLLHMADNSV